MNGVSNFVKGQQNVSKIRYSFKKGSAYSTGLPYKYPVLGNRRHLRILYIIDYITVEEILLIICKQRTAFLISPTNTLKAKYDCFSKNFKNLVKYQDICDSVLKIFCLNLQLHLRFKCANFHMINF